ncbi:MAG TPA: DUF1801 domain-containing protein [Gemmataceae bacterium]|jgi:hypothetical protein
MKTVRKPPPDLIRFLSAYPPFVAELFLSVRAVVLTCAPTANEIIVDAYSAVATGYTFTERFKEAFCHIAAYSTYVNLGFSRGTELADPRHVLKGTGKLTRHIRIAELDDLQAPHIKRFLGAAIAKARAQVEMPHGEPDEPWSKVTRIDAQQRRPPRIA